MKIYINESFGYGMAVAIVAANSPEEAQWLTKDIERSDFKEGHLFDVEKWHELDGTPEYRVYCDVCHLGFYASENFK